MLDDVPSCIGIDSQPHAGDGNIFGMSYIGMTKAFCSRRNVNLIVDEIAGIGIFAIGKFQITILRYLFIRNSAAVVAAALATRYMGQ